MKKHVKEDRIFTMEGINMTKHVKWFWVAVAVMVAQPACTQLGNYLLHVTGAA